MIARSPMSRSQTMIAGMSSPTASERSSPTTAMENAHTFAELSRRGAIPRSREERRDGSRQARRIRRPGTRAGAARENDDELLSTKEMLPARPVWLGEKDVIYRDRLFATFRGLFTYGSPLDKFAAIWPPRVPINKKEVGLVLGAGGKRREWIYVYDPTDPVAAKLDAFGTPKGIGPNVLEPITRPTQRIGCCCTAIWQYFRPRERAWAPPTGWSTGVLTGSRPSLPPDAAKSLWLDPKSGWFWLRRIEAIITWLVAYVILTALGALSLPLLAKPLRRRRRRGGQEDRRDMAEHVRVSRGRPGRGSTRSVQWAASGAWKFVLAASNDLLARRPDRPAARSAGRAAPNLPLAICSGWRCTFDVLPDGCCGSRPDTSRRQPGGRGRRVVLQIRSGGRRESAYGGDRDSWRSP